MPKSHPPYPPEFRRQMVELVRAGRTPRELAREFECSDQTIRNWVRQTESLRHVRSFSRRGAGSSIPPTADVRIAPAPPRQSSFR